MKFLLSITTLVGILCLNLPQWIMQKILSTKFAIITWWTIAALSTITSFMVTLGILMQYVHLMLEWNPCHMNWNTGWSLATVFYDFYLTGIKKHQIGKTQPFLWRFYMDILIFWYPKRVRWKNTIRDGGSTAPLMRLKW